MGDIISQPKVRQIVEQALYSYNIAPKETLPAVLDDVREKIFLYLATKKTEGLSGKSITHYGRILAKFSDYMRKNVEDITAMDIRVYSKIFSNRCKEHDHCKSYRRAKRIFQLVR